MPIIKEIDTQIPEAMRAKDAVRLGVLRGMKAACVNELIAKRRKPEEALTDEETVAVIKRLVNQRRDSTEQFRKGGREELAQSEEAELCILEAFLPKMMGESEIRAIAKRKKAELTIADTSKIGSLVGAVMKECKGRADGGAVRKVIESLFVSS
ncbi:MAG: hypothetical protein A2W52_03525 [Candidatus Taylorbacteria bacterium RIFCSPHIGHO2_02_49_25]|uniref:Glutamyl-tRNA amidotransferase n=1 Tax=Candidatus Taylorbacteria bacterium RIFCSPHIGHO2_02_49_25 TaxID=1802305 RepID=A0A1G2MD81_9BACT|nr:MAG: hypothetical protein UY62_C0031G0007 [Parcubacteria group bacterium GW2011_GWF2_50_9]OHA20801.1 MAG: hypothetical protein A2759_03030 [Candidatus Taylorbacteria bacterium RIFCSPHIGHO2_01_FULL_49_60]OHA21875.1 MAG: hypothetical protein A2W52_03525 [Candidatus Taylorbacteria bacterium RIFCSPHIGHO2_02_49_25]OHA36683.1 MAG: hypothetical protein A3B27_01265 [Candidatus Taylorbacteria bacterium RIFCSPLOWO2_01_FULL_50_130]OHA37553.1 MAG: hypothetical protein A2W65_02980 [Candidatus Taylorbacte